MSKITAALIGAGDRGFHCYAPYAQDNPWKIEFTAIAEKDDEKRKRFGDEFNIAEERRFSDLFQLLNQPRLADALLLCTSDTLHYEPALRAMKKGYHIMLEKPMSTNLKECIKLFQAAKGYDKTFILCYVLRYTEFFSVIKKNIDDGRIGQINTILHIENIPLTDQVHSFTRGIFRNTEVSCPIIIAHCCHDLDLISWYSGSKCRKVASFGNLTHFRRENAPEGAPERCLDNCPHSKSCPYYAPRYYLTDDVGWPTSTICSDMSYEARYEAIKNGPYGRCVYKCDNNVVDNQTVIMEFSNGVTATFAMYPFASANGRTLKITGTKGEIRANMDLYQIEVFDILSGKVELVRLKPSRYKYGGGDNGIMEYFTDMVERNEAGGLTSMESSIESHIIAFAAEKSRTEGIVVDIADFLKSAGL